MELLSLSVERGTQVVRSQPESLLVPLSVVVGAAAVRGRRELHRAMSAFGTVDGGGRSTREVEALGAAYGPRAVRCRRASGAYGEAAGRTVSTYSLWAVVDLANGETLVAGPDGSPYRPLELRQDGDWTAFLGDRTYAELAVLRAGVGGWRWAISDGGSADGDFADDGRLTLDLTRAVPIPPIDEDLTLLLPGDVVVGIDPRAEEYVALALSDTWF